MSKLNCPCGNQLSDVGYPCMCKGSFFTETQADIILKKGIEIDTIFSGFGPKELEPKEVWTCPACGRMAVQVKGAKFAWYWKEGEK